MNICIFEVISANTRRWTRSSRVGRLRHFGRNEFLQGFPEKTTIFFTIFTNGAIHEQVQYIRCLYLYYMNTQYVMSAKLRSPLDIILYRGVSRPPSPAPRRSSHRSSPNNVISYDMLDKMEVPQPVQKKSISVLKSTGLINFLGCTNGKIFPYGITS